MQPIIVAICALFIGSCLAIYIEWLSRRERRFLQMATLPQAQQWTRSAVVVGSTIGVFCVYSWASMHLKCLDTPEVQPSYDGHTWRLIYHLTLLSFLIVATAVDFDCYMIPDAITVPGVLMGVIGACLIREAQICHLWVDWWYAKPQIQGPYIPDWYDTHRLWHALAWSVAGLVTGAGITGVARWASSCVLGQEAMGLGDVTLMAMIGSFLGWQAVTLVFLIAPITGLVFGLLIRMLSGKTYLPYGPWLSIAAFAVLLFWTHLWRMTRLIFSDTLSVVALGIVGSLTFVALLWLLQLYKSIPTREKLAEPQSTSS